MKENKIEVFKRCSYRDDDSGKVFLASLICPLIITLIFSMIATQISTQREINISQVTSNLWFVSIYALMNFIVNILIFFIYNSINKISINASKIKFKFSWKTYLIVILIGIVSLFGIQYFIQSVNDFLSLIGIPMDGGVTINPTDFGTFILAIFLLAVLPAISEELLFRGIVFNGLRSRISDWGAVVLSSLMFALMHGNLLQLVYPFILGMVMAWIVMRTGSIVASMIIHFTNNFLVVVFAYIENTTGWSVQLPSQWWFYLLSLILLALTFLVYFLIDKFYFRHKNKEDVEKISTKFSIYNYIALGISIFILILNTITLFA